MYDSVLGLHSYWAYATLGLLLIATLNAFGGLSSKRVFTPKDRQISMIALIFSHIQLLLGFVLYFVSPYFETAKQAGMGAVMKDSTLRLYLVEHPLINIIAIALITIGWSKHKKTEDNQAKFKKIGYMYAIALVLLLSRIPWSAWFN
ncbi:hypothetical protein [Flavobacterium beibuense]|uniref:50S ribosomal protein L27 n=1 Tax=Flavobacterium beibuense F44-8 TaxID=1406840 RepID=A0A0A2LLN3_9FLAO|nr:hypothetical protein [Flavobacterium beibuense]KGO81157.1 hypothetical protein Q763_08720 [Flavobacterium beibuense F44-8]